MKDLLIAEEFLKSKGFPINGPTSIYVENVLELLKEFAILNRQDIKEKALKIHKECFDEFLSKNV